MDIKEIFDVLKIDRVARKMGMSRVSLSQRINGTMKNGKAVVFSSEELELLRKALNELAGEIISNAERLKKS